MFMGDRTAGGSADLYVILLPEQLLAEPDQHRRVALLGLLHLKAAQVRFPLQFAVLEDFPERELGAFEIVPHIFAHPEVDGRRRDVEPGRDFVQRRLERAELRQVIELLRGRLPARASTFVHAATSRRSSTAVLPVNFSHLARITSQ